MKKNSHLPLFGAGPFYVITISVMTVTALLLHHFGVISFSSPYYVSLVLKIAGILMIIAGVFIWFEAAIACQLTKNIKANKLITTGIYAYVRHPIYSAFTIAEWGMLFWTGNIYLFLLIPLYWAFFTILMKKTEEKWMEDKFGDEYREYSRRVNRCIPWFPKKKTDA